MENPTLPEEEILNQEQIASEAAASATQEQEQTLKKDEQQEQMKKLQDELAEAKDKYVRLYAEFDNHRRRTAKEKIEMISSANEQLLKSLLPVVDDFDRAEKTFKNKNDKEAEGFFLIHNKFKKIFEQAGVKQMETVNGSDFNPDLQEAITQIPAPTEKLKGKIVDTVEKGYLLNDKVIRFAKVVVGS
jgi:molecular chaperone GrpE